MQRTAVFCVSVCVCVRVGERERKRGQRWLLCISWRCEDIKHKLKHIHAGVKLPSYFCSSFTWQRGERGWHGFVAYYLMPAPPNSNKYFVPTAHTNTEFTHRVAPRSFQVFQLFRIGLCRPLLSVFLPVNHPALCPPPTPESSNFLQWKVKLLSFIFPIHPPIISSILRPALLSWSCISRKPTSASQLIPATKKKPNHYWLHSHEKHISQPKIRSLRSFCNPTASGHLLISSLRSLTPLFAVLTAGVFSLHTSAETSVFWSISLPDSLQSSRTSVYAENINSGAPLSLSVRSFFFTLHSSPSSVKLPRLPGYSPHHLWFSFPTPVLKSVFHQNSSAHIFLLLLNIPCVRFLSSHSA